METPNDKVFDLTKGQWIEKPADASTTTTTTEQQKTDTPVAGDPPPVTDNPPNTDANKPDEKPADVKPEDKPVTFEPGSYIKEKFGEKYGFESEKDLEDAFAAQEQFLDDFQKLREENERLKTQPVYRSEQEKKIADFLKPYDPSRFGEGLNTAAAIMGMDPAQVDGRRALEEAYILQHPELTRDEAKELFAHDYNTKYSINKDAFDDENQYNSQKRIVDIQLKAAEAQARKTLAERKEQLKSAEQPKTEQQPQFQIPEETVNEYLSQVNNFLNPSGGKFDKFTFSDGKENTIHVPLSKEQVLDLTKFMESFVKNPSVYSQNKKIDNFAPAELAKVGARILFGDLIERKLMEQIPVLAAKMKAEQITQRTPDKKPSGTGDAKLSIDDQFAELANKQRAERLQRRA